MNETVDTNPQFWNDSYHFILLCICWLH